MAVVLTDGEDHQILAEQINLLGPASHPDVPLHLGAQGFVLFKGIFKRNFPWSSRQPAENFHKQTVTLNFCWWWTGTNSQSSTSKALTWIRCKLGKQYLVKKFTLPWESNPGPFSNPGRCGNPSSVCWVKKNSKFLQSQLVEIIGSKIGLWRGNAL